MHIYVADFISVSNNNVYSSSACAHLCVHALRTVTDPRTHTLALTDSSACVGGREWVYIYHINSVCVCVCVCVCVRVCVCACVRALAFCIYILPR